MSLSKEQYLNIINEYDQLRRENYMEEQLRREEIYSAIPEIRLIDEKIAHTSIERAKKMIFHPDTDERDSLKAEIYNLSMEKVNLLAIHHYPIDYLDPIYHCSKCKDTGFIGSEKCSCFEQKLIDILYHQSNLRDLVKKENFSTFQLNYYSDKGSEDKKLSPRDNILHILSLSHDFIDTFDTEPGKNLFVYGHAGVGKTFLTNCIANELLKKGKSVIYLTAYQFFHQLEKYTFHREKEDADPLPFLLNCDLLIIDDLGTELNNAFINSQLFLSINERMIGSKSTIISTNLSLEQINRTYSQRVFSRIIEAYTLLHIYGEDIRLKKAFSSLDETK